MDCFNSLKHWTDDGFDNWWQAKGVITASKILIRVIFMWIYLSFLTNNVYEQPLSLHNWNVPWDLPQLYTTHGIFLPYPFSNRYTTNIHRILKHCIGNQYVINYLFSTYSIYQHLLKSIYEKLTSNIPTLTLNNQHLLGYWNYEHLQSSNLNPSVLRRQAPRCLSEGLHRQLRGEWWAPIGSGPVPGFPGGSQVGPRWLPGEVANFKK